MQTQLYRDQHGRLREHARAMLSAKAEADHRKLLAQLAGQVKMHLKAEDDSLYPRLLSHDDADVRTKAKKLQDSMGTIAHSFDGFYQKWITGGAIAGNTAGYLTEMRGIVNALSQRMDMEDRELYDFADKL
jgi:hypothetical protein